MAAAQPESRDGAAQSAKPASETDPLSRFTCPVCLEVFEKPVQVPCGHVFCSACLQECLKPKKPVCGVCRSALAPGVRAVELERQIESIETSCHGCRKNFILSKIRAHVTSCSKYQNYIMEGVKATTKDASLQPRNIPNRYTFPCPYCPEKNFDQEGLVEHCKLTHSTDTKSVVCPICASMPWGDPSYRSANFMEHIQRRHRFSLSFTVPSGKVCSGDVWREVQQDLPRATGKGTGVPQCSRDLLSFITLAVSNMTFLSSSYNSWKCSHVTEHKEEHLQSVPQDRPSTRPGAWE